MPEYEVKGVGKINLPEGLSEAEIQSALDSHPDVIEHVKKQSAKFGWDVITDRLKGKNTPIDNSGANELKALSTAAAQGVPVVGNYVPESKESRDYMQQHPIMGNMVKAEGSIAANTAASAGLGAVPALARGAPWLASQVIGNVGLAGADKAAQEHSQGQNINTADMLKAMSIGGGATLAGAGASKFISPNFGVKPPTPFVSKPPTGGSYEDVLARTRWNNPQNTTVREQLEALINSERVRAAQRAFEEAPAHELAGHAVRAAGTVLGHAAGAPGILSHLATGFHQNVLKNQIMNDPTRAALMQALLASGGQSLNRIPDAQ